MTTAHKTLKELAPKTKFLKVMFIEMTDAEKSSVEIVKGWLAANDY
ncbi:MAG: hypothetical protein IJ583_02325 [Firmicutes bacterium]|nr:hypothetical protein [Bacillota bacterium]